ncbi:PilZ domain-containing protein [Phycisphaera mikurensis]|uniref:PilZ domain-containing protein n=1 Tax=Phycisphaera mikurensis (strain NBRC 102666 / KCTC 22515 / FYK2301M01) TaxID=1142394 RepID=I0IBM0_PHYMF|nr:PilZ domain-containing protein [Phycisphaera mikurensis]MBB6442813.1 hypothetical protein [Phycisphaera mikurensis]BAM02658.1 hypothetical protein PSMK_04990 [Phycisphaera mikurensis NBRC 102666]
MTANPVNVAASTDRRHFPRWSTAGLESALGRVTDLSLSGMRIRKTGNPGLREGDRFRLEVRHEETVFLLPAQLASVRPHAGGGGGGMVDLGIRFPEMTKAQKRTVKRMLEAAGWPDGGGEILFKALPEDGDEDAALAAPAAPAAPAVQEAPPPVPPPVAAVPRPAPATAAPEPPTAPEPAEPDASMPELAFSPLPLPGLGESEAEPAAPESPLPGLASWSQLTEAADGTLTAAEAAAAARAETDPAPPTEPVAAPPAAGGGLSAEEAQEIAALGAGAAGLADLAGAAAAPSASPTPAAGVPNNHFQAQPVDSGLRHLPASGLEGSAPRQQNQRKNGRLAAQDAHTALGEVLDISASGMRIRRRGTKPVEVGSHFLLDLYVCGRAVRLPVEVVRIMKSGWRSYDYGLRFGELPPEMRAQFGMLARMAAKHVSIA